MEQVIGPSTSTKDAVLAALDRAFRVSTDALTHRIAVAKTRAERDLAADELAAAYRIGPLLRVSVSQLFAPEIDLSNGDDDSVLMDL